MKVPTTSEKPKLGVLFLLWFIIAVTWGLSGWFLHADTSNRGTFGDMFGAVNALFSGLAFATLIYTAWMQRDELALQRQELAATRRELEGQRLQLAEQTATFALQRFEDSFFALLRTHSELINAMDLIDENSRTTKSRDCFKVWYKRFCNIYAQEIKLYPEEQSLQAVQSAYRKFHDKHQAELGHYFRHLYHIIKLIKDTPITEKQKYTSLVRAQLSAYEHLMLFYNCLSEFGYHKFKPLIEEFALLENMPQSKLIAKNLHIQLYELSAYGEDSTQLKMA